MENTENSNLEKNSIALEIDGVNHLNETIKWTKLISIVGFVFISIMLIVIIILLILSLNAGIIPTAKFSFTQIIPLFLISVIYFFPVFYLFQFSKKSKLAIHNNDSSLLSNGLKYLKMHYRFMGILMIVVFVIYLFFGLFILYIKFLK